ncbi:TPA: YjbQ family protein [Candidatus Bathyarchaeota archaeon]|nr:YjbQ family protein [Candidatus Bathyarchaeota archaeon]
MKVKFKEIRVDTSDRVQLVDVTDLVENFVRESGISDGLCLIYSPHSTTAIIVNEKESGLMKDILAKVRRDFPAGAGWLHDRVDDNAHSHLASTFIGSSTTFPVKNASLLKGTWQNIFLLEMDGPRARRLVVEVLGTCR